MKMKLGQKIIDLVRLKKLRKKLALKNSLKEIENQNKNIIKTLGQKIKNGEKLKVAFLHMYSASIQNICIFEKMLNSKYFDPYFIVNPDVARSKENFDYNYNRTKTELIEKYGKEKVLDGYDYDKDEYIDYTSDFDLATTSNPYDAMAHEKFQIKYWIKSGIPMFYIPYFYMGRCRITKVNLKMPEFSMFWKVFVENENTLKLAKKHEILKGKNIVVSGYPKMDKLAGLKAKKNSRKTVILAPHHAINMKLLASFLEYAEFLPKLVDKYKDIDFVFRPHPLLIQNLKKDEFWGEEKAEKWFNDFTTKENVVYSTNGDYLQLFADSDALMHDCGSFMAEYLYTNKPCAFFVGKNLHVNKVLTSFGKTILKKHYLLHNFEEHCDFLETVVLKENDKKEKERTEFAKREIMINYPNAADYIYNNILTSLDINEK